jgi:cysteine desulfurase
VSSVIYLDHHAATPLSPAAARAMDAARASSFGNPASVHGPGRRARAALEDARAAIARSVDATPSEIVLTSGGTEACNLGVLGLARSAPGRVVVSAIEHPAVLAAAERLRERGFAITTLDVPRGCPPSPEVLAAAITDDTRLVAVQWINHETGTVLPVDAYARIAHARGVPMFVDATQALGKVDLSFRALGVTAMALASHKLGGPAGIGALVLARGAPLDPQIVGGAQERGLRAGTPDVTAAAGFGAACAEVAVRVAASPRIAELRDRIEREAIALGGRVNGDGGARAVTATDVSFAGWRGSTLVAALDLEGLAIASGAACSSGLDKPSPVVLAMYADDPSRASSAIRISLGPETTRDEIDRSIEILRRVLARRGA